MRIEQTFISDDGKKFTTEAACREYEEWLLLGWKHNTYKELRKYSCQSEFQFILENFSKIKAIVEAVKIQDNETDTEVDWDTVPEGTLIFVRDYEDCEWNIRKFICKFVNSDFPFRCRYEDGDTANIGWAFAKLLHNN